MPLHTTEYIHENGRLHSGPYVYGRDHEDAERNLPKNPKGLRVTGELVAVIEVDESEKWYQDLLNKKDKY